MYYSWVYPNVCRDMNRGKSDELIAKGIIGIMLSFATFEIELNARCVKSLARVTLLGNLECHDVTHTSLPSTSQSLYVSLVVAVSYWNVCHAYNSYTLVI